MSAKRILMYGIVATGMLFGCRTAGNQKDESQKGEVAREDSATLCRDQMDNDNDLHVDCDDQDCEYFPWCEAGGEVARSSDTSDTDVDADTDPEREGCAGVAIEIPLVVCGIALYAMESLRMSRKRDWNYKEVFLKGGQDGGRRILRREGCPLCGGPGVR